MPERPAQHGIEDQLWPIALATAVLMGVLFVVIYVCGDFDDERLLYNGYTQLAAVAVLGAAIVFIGSKIKGRARRTAELAILLSLALHALGGLSAVYLFDSSLSGSGRSLELNIASTEGDEETPPADYHWGQNDDASDAPQAFEKPVETVVRDQTTPAAQVKPRDVERPVPATEVPRAVKADITPLGAAAAAPGKPLDVRRPEAAKVSDLPPPDALAMVRQKGQDAAIPDSPAPSPVAMPEAPKEPAKSIEPRAVQAEKAEKYLWAKVATKSIDPNNPDAPPPKMARSEAPSSDPLPSPDIIARAPSQAPPRTSTVDSGAEAADKISLEGRSQARFDRGADAPSTVLPNAGFAAQLPAAEGGSPPSSLENRSTVAVEQASNSHAPLGPNIASAGAQDFARGSSPLPTRRGAIEGRGRAEPSIGGDANEDLDELRAGSPGSNLPYGMAQSAAPARRAAASQTEDGGTDLSSGQSGTLPRTQAQMGLPLPAAAQISENVLPSGAGGVGDRPGGLPSTLHLGQNITVERVAGNGVPGGVSRDETYAGIGTGDTTPGGAAVGIGTGRGLGPGGPRRVDVRTSDGADNGTGIPRSRGDVFTPHATVEPGGVVGGTATVAQGPVQGSGLQGYRGPTVGPDDSLGGIGRLDGPGQRVGTRPNAPIEPAEIASAIGVGSPQTSGLGNRSRHGDTQLDQVLAGDEGTRGRGAGRAQIDVNSLVHEPLDAFRRGPAGGSALGDSGDGQLTEPAIEHGLEYFARTQFPDGHWSLHESPPGTTLDATSLGELHADTAATGLALLTYMAAGYTHQDEKYRDTVHRGLEWLMKHQSADGNLSYRGSDATHFYSQGIATMALCEAYGMTQDRELRAAAQKAIDFIVAAQDPSRGGWRYVAREGSDTSVTGWQLMALRSAKMAGLNVPDETLRKIGHWLDLAHSGRGTYVYNPWNLDTAEESKGRAPSPTMTAQAMVMRMYLGENDQAALRQGADYLMAHLPEPAGAETALRDCYYWYYGNMAMFLLHGDYWKAWNDRVTPLVRAGQIERGPLKGSWSGNDPVPDYWNAKAGRHYVTAMHVLTLEFRYWHLPLFRELRRE